MSMQYTVAAQLVDGQVLVDQFGPSELNRPQIQEMMAKTEPVHQTDFDRSLATTWRATVTVRFADGAEVSTSLNAAKGMESEASQQGIFEKWRILVGRILDEKTRVEIDRCDLGLGVCKMSESLQSFSRFL